MPVLPLLTPHPDSPSPSAPSSLVPFNPLSYHLMLCCGWASGLVVTMQVDPRVSSSNCWSHCSNDLLAPPDSLIPLAPPLTSITLPVPLKSLKSLPLCSIYPLYCFSWLCFGPRSQHSASVWLHLKHLVLQLRLGRLNHRCPISSPSVPRAPLSMAFSLSVVLWMSSAKTPSWLLPPSTPLWICIQV